MKNTQIAENERVTNGTKKWKKRGQMTSFLDSMEARVRYEKGEIKRGGGIGKGPIPWLFNVRCARP